jgi:hypothetical protein
MTIGSGGARTLRHVSARDEIVQALSVCGAPRIVGCVLAVVLSSAGPVAQAPATNGFYIHAERGWVPLTAYAEFHAATETLRLVNGWTDDIPDVTDTTRFAIQMPNWSVGAVLLTGGDLFSSRYAERRNLTYGIRRTSVYGREIEVGKSDPASLDKLLDQVGVSPGGAGYVFLVVGTEGFPTRYYPVRVRRGGAGGMSTTPPSSPAVFEWPGACPTECCGYGTTWTAREETPAFAVARVPGASAPAADPAFTIPAGGAVRAVTGTLYTVETGTARVEEDFSTDATFTDFSTRHKQPVTFLAGEMIELLAPRGNGVYRIVHDDRVVDANLYRLGTPASCKAANVPCAGIITKEPVTEWWVMVLNSEKQSGWINDPTRFARGTCR